MHRWRRALAAALLGTTAVIAQSPTSKAPTPEMFRSPDGSRFVLVPTGGPPQVHWAVATPAGAAEDPDGLQGLAAAVLAASLGGTWTSGSVDAAAERATLAELERSQEALLANPGDAELIAKVQQLEVRAQQLGDPRVFARLLAAAPMSGVRTSVRDSVGLLEFTTVPSAIGRVAELLVERREQQVLRGFGRFWFDELAARIGAYDGDPLAPLHAELLALAMPEHPVSRAAERPGAAIPRRSQALAVWQATQYPKRTVHVLLGGFDAAAVRATLDATFAQTNLPSPTAPEPYEPRAIASLRRSTIPGTGRSLVALAWVLPKVDDPILPQLAATWLGSGPEGQLATRLRQQGRKSATVSCRAPWPVVTRARSLLLIEVGDPAGVDGLADLVAKTCGELAQKPPPQPTLDRALRSLRASWNLVTAEPRWLAAETARSALLWPGRRPELAPPDTVAPATVRKLLAETFANRPVIVEARK
ncbi:MAG: hypothetical protein KDE27_07790 [Planctomycetes bacterium]|nr:hypothetical protein [Planctomycetota bacterium]